MYNGQLDETLKDSLLKVLQNHSHLLNGSMMSSLKLTEYLSTAVMLILQSESNERSANRTTQSTQKQSHAEKTDETVRRAERLVDLIAKIDCNLEEASASESDVLRNLRERCFEELDALNRAECKTTLAVPKQIVEKCELLAEYVQLARKNHQPLAVSNETLNEIIDALRKAQGKTTEHDVRDAVEPIHTRVDYERVKDSIGQ